MSETHDLPIYTPAGKLPLFGEDYTPCTSTSSLCLHIGLRGSWRIRVERVEQAERRAAWVVCAALALLCLYVLATSILGLVLRSRPEGSPLRLWSSCFSWFKKLAKRISRDGH